MPPVVENGSLQRDQNHHCQLVEELQKVLISMPIVE
jgi:hypothetical protein